jgi:hypothetical protein
MYLGHVGFVDVTAVELVAADARAADGTLDLGL